MNPPAMKYLKIALATVILLVGLLLGLLLQDELFGHFLAALAALVILVPLSALLIVAVLVHRKMKRKVGQVLSFATTIAGSSVLAVFVFQATNGRMDAWKNHAVKAYVARAVPILDGYKARHGAYPISLPVSLLGEPPELLQKFGDYSSDGKEFHFEYIDEPAGWAGGEGFLEFTSSERKWIDER